MTSAHKWSRRAAIGAAIAALALFGGGWTFEHLAELDDRRFKPPGELVDIGGRKLHLSCTGSGSPTVVLEPGGGEFSLLIAPLQRRIATFTHVCSYDRAGYAWSDPAPPGRTFDQRAADLDRLLASAQVEGPYVLVGASYGGFLVRSFARQEPPKVAGMVLVDAAEENIVYNHLPLFKHAVVTQRVAQLLAEFGLMRPAVAQLARQAREAGQIPPDARPEDVAAAIAFDARPSAFRTDIDEFSAYESTPASERRPGGFGALGNRPLVVIRHGKPLSGLNAALAELEPGWAEAQARLAALSTDSRTVVAAQNGHDIARENPVLVADAVHCVVKAVRTRTTLAGQP
ncbi:MAG TPA: alpha/beta hydrolase [Caulobacteraceae bacterium]|nr:alpha/beta hydrolase [Caulobacteraceae bacterium]